MDDIGPQESFDLRDILGFLRRRRVAVTVTAALLVLAAFATAFLWPPVYRSVATILVEEQEIPQDLVRSTVTSYADQRIQVIGQQVMTRANLLQIVEKYDLYAQPRKTETNEEILERMRKDVKVDVLSADVAGGRRVTIAFTLSYDGETADRAQKVANELVTLYLNENLKIRQQKAAETESFLTEEAKQLESHIAETEAKLAQFKRQNISRLPELAQLNMQLREKTETEVADIDRETRLIEQRRFFLENQLAQTRPRSPIISSTGERILSPEDRLRTLKTQQASLTGIYSADHPDMIRMKREIASLEQELGGTMTDDERAKQVEKLESEAAELRERYSEDHPDLVRLRKLIAALNRGDDQERTGPKAEIKADNPSYLSLQTQLRVLDAEAQGLRKKREEATAKLSIYEARIVQTPQVEQEYLDLVRDRENTLARYREMKSKLSESQVAEDLEKDRKGERFSLIDPPQLPERPRSPNRPAILLLGVVVALGGGLGYGGLLEALDPSIKGPKHLGRSFGAPILSVIPHIETAGERAARRRTHTLLWVGLLAALIAAALLVHFFYMPLEVLWYWLPRRLGIAL